MTKKIEDEIMLNFVKHFYLDNGRLPKAKELNHRVTFFRRFSSMNTVMKILNIPVRVKSPLKKAKGPYIKIRLPLIDDPRLGRFMGIYAADGSSYHDSYGNSYVIQLDFNEQERELIENTKKLCFDLFKKKPFVMTKKDHVVRLTYKSKKLFFFIRKFLDFNRFKSHSVRLKKLNFSEDWFIGFLGGLLDGDGLIRYKRGYETRFVSSSSDLKNQVLSMLSRFGFIPNVYECDSKRSKWFNISVYGSGIISFLSREGSVKAKNIVLISKQKF